jgi:hypothetical protein
MAMMALLDMSTPTQQALGPMVVMLPTVALVVLATRKERRVLGPDHPALLRVAAVVAAIKRILLATAITGKAAVAVVLARMSYLLTMSQTDLCRDQLYPSPLVMAAQQ